MKKTIISILPVAAAICLSTASARGELPPSFALIPGDMLSSAVPLNTSEEMDLRGNRTMLVINNDRMFVFQEEEPPAPIRLRAVRTGDNTARISWDAAAGAEVSGFNVYRAAGPDAPVKLNATPVANLFYDDESLVPYRSYTYYVELIESDGDVSTMARIVLRGASRRIQS